MTKDTEIKMLRNTLVNIVNWQQDAIDYDKENDNDPREFCEDVELIGNYANMRLDHISENK